VLRGAASRWPRSTVRLGLLQNVSMRSSLVVTFIGVATALLSGCATLSEDQCRQVDWKDLGRRDGAQGQSPERVQDHAKACSKVGIAPDVAMWRAGWREGVVGYCTPRSAWSEGSRNQSYRGACRDLDEEGFRRWHRAGLDVYRTRTERERSRSEIERLEAQLKKAEKEDERKTLRDRIRALDVEQARLRRLQETLEAAAPR